MGFGSLFEVQDQVFAAEIEAGLKEANRIIQRGAAATSQGRATEGIQQYRQAGSILRRAAGTSRRIVDPLMRQRMTSLVGPVLAHWDANNLDERRTAQRGLAGMEALPALPSSSVLFTGAVASLLAWWLWTR